MRIKRKEIYSAIIGVILVIATQIILRSIDSSKTSLQILLMVLLTIGIIYPIVMLSYRDKLLGFKLNLIGSLITSSGCVLVSLLLVLLEFFQNQADKHVVLTLILIALCFASFLGLIIFWIVVSTKFVGKRK